MNHSYPAIFGRIDRSFRCIFRVRTGGSTLGTVGGHDVDEPAPPSHHGSFECTRPAGRLRLRRWQQDSGRLEGFDVATVLVHRQTSATKAFKVPLTVMVDPYLGSPPTIDSPNLLSWDASISTEKVRFLVPVKLYRPDSATPEPPPKDYLKYLQGLAKHGVEFSNVSKVSVDGHPGSLMTATSDIDKIPAGSLNGTLGCATPAATKTTEGDCFGVVPDLLLRIAVVKVGGTALVAWARTRKDEPNEAFFAVFDRMLRSVRLR